MERYQESYLPGGISTGERPGAERWDLIAPHVPRSGVMLDVGSNLGYFGLRAAAANPELAVVSLEADPVIARRQAEIASAHGHSRIVVLQGSMSSTVAGRWSSTCDYFDATLLLSILHWMDDPTEVVRALSSMSGRLICEVPDIADAGSCGPEKLALWGSEPVAWFGRVTGRNAREIGRMRRHTSSVPSHVILVDGPVRRHASRAYWDGPPLSTGLVIDHDGLGTTIVKDGQVRRYIPGVNMVNLMRVGALRFPDVSWWHRTCSSELRAHRDHPDPYPHNLLWSSRGVSLVDWDPVDAALTTADGLRTLAIHLPRWVSGRTMDGGAIREAALFQRMRTSTIGQAVLRLVPASLKRRIRWVVYRR